MKTTLLKRVLAFALVLATLLPCLVNTAKLPVFAVSDNQYAEPVVYDIYDLTGSQTNTVKGTDETWDGVLLGEIRPEDKENIVFKTKLTMGAQQVRLALNAKEGTSIYDPPGYAVYINDNNGAPYIAIYRNQKDLVVGSIDSVAGTWELEIGIVDILTDGVRTGKHIYVKMDGEVVCEVDDTDGYLTGDSLGTRFVDFHYGAAIQMDTTKTGETTYGTPNVYDIYDLTGSQKNTVNGTDVTWDGVLLGTVSPEHKENIVFKTKLTMGAQQIRLSLNAKEGASIYDPPGYAVYINDNNNAPYIAIRRNNHDLVVGSVASVKDTWELEIGILDILTDGVRTGKHLYVKQDGVIVCETDDNSGYLTGDSLGTSVVDFHYGAAIQMDTTKQIEPTDPTEPEPTEPSEPQTVADATVYDIYDLTGSAANTVNGTDVTWDGVFLGEVSPEHKENIVFKTKLTMGAQQIRLSLNAKEGASIYDPPGYAVYINDNNGAPYISIRRNNHDLVVGSVASVQGTWELEIGLQDILADGVRTGKHLYVKQNGVTVCEADDVNGYLTGDSLGTRVVDFHYGAAIKMDTTKDIDPGTQPEFGELAAADATVYDLYDLHGTEELILEGRASNPDNWGTTLGNVLTEHKENMAFKTTVTMDEAQTVMLGLGIGDMSQAVRLDSGYVLEIMMKTGAGEVDTVKIHKAGTQIYGADQSKDLNGVYELEFGVVDLCDMDAEGKVVGKRIYVKIDGEEILSYDDTSGYLTGDSLGTKVDVYVSGVDLPMASIRNYQAVNAVVYDLYDLAFRESLEVKHTDDGGNINWGVLIGNVEEAHKGNVALRTKVSMSRNQQQNLIIGLGLNGHWPVGSGHGYKIELNGNPDNKTDSLFVYKNTDSEGKDPVCIYSMEQDFDFNSNFQLEVGVIDLTDSEKKVAARRIYVLINGKELMHIDDTRNVVSGSNMGTVVAAYASSGTAVLSTCVNGIPKTDVKVYDIFDLSGRAAFNLTRTDAGGEVIWSNEIGQIADTNNMNYALRVNVDTGKVDRSTMQELILGLCKDSDLFDKTGYRLSMYFGTDGGTSLVLRSSATDEVLASVDETFPQNYELEIGITDFFNSSRKLVGKKIYLKINSEEVLSYLDKDLNRARGNLLCAYTTSPVKMTTKYGYCTIPVTYVVGGETVETSKYITANTDVVAGKKSIIDIALVNTDEFTSVIMKQVLLNDQPIKSARDKKGVYEFELDNPSADDQLTVELEVHNLTVDEATVYDLYEITGKQKIVIPAYSVDQIGTLFADGQEGVLNRAIRFAYYIPETGGGLRLGYGSDTSDIWSRVGTHIEIWCGFATISHGFHVSALSTGSTNIFQPDSWSIVEVGIVKCYEDGVYKYDRWYVKAGSTLEEMELITYYDSTQRHESTLNIMARTPDTGGDFILASTLDVRQVTDVSEEAAKADADVTFKPLFLKGEAVKIVVFPKEGKDLEKLIVNGEQAEIVLTSDGGYMYTMENAEENVEFSYTLSDDDRVYNITADEAANLEILLEKTAVTAGGAVTVQIKMDGGYTLKSLVVNDVDYLPMASYNKTTLTYTLTVSHIREDKHIQAQAEKIMQDSPVANAGAANENSIMLLVIIAAAILAVAVLGGASAIVVTRGRKKGQKQ